MDEKSNKPKRKVGRPKGSKPTRTNAEKKILRRQTTKKSETIVELDVKDDDGSPLYMVLSIKQDNFCNNIAKGLSLEEAYADVTNADADPNEIRRRAKKMYGKPEVQARIKQLILERSDSISVDEAFVIEHLKKIVAESPTSNVGVRALELLGKHLAMFVDRKIVDTNESQRDLAQKMFERRAALSRGEEVPSLETEKKQDPKLIKFKIKDGTNG